MLNLYLIYTYYIFSYFIFWQLVIKDEANKNLHFTVRCMRRGLQFILSKQHDFIYKKGILGSIK